MAQHYFMNVPLRDRLLQALKPGPVGIDQLRARFGTSHFNKAAALRLTPAPQSAAASFSTIPIADSTLDAKQMPRKTFTQEYNQSESEIEVFHALPFAIPVLLALSILILAYGFSVI